MPSHFKYRIKKASENKLSVYDYNSVPREIIDSYKQSGLYQDSDRNIVPGTCAFISIERDQGKARYLCGIKVHARRVNLIASNETCPSPTVDGSGEGRVSGAIQLEKSDYFYGTHFRCNYIDELTAEAKKEGVGQEETVQFPMCSCYSPRGGLAITHFDGAVKDTEATGYAPGKNVVLPKSYDAYQNPGSDPNLSGPIPKHITANARSRFPASPPRLGFIYLMMNARASLIPCCWWIGKGPILYRPDHFRVVDLAVAQEYFKKDQAENPSNSTLWGVSNVADYVYREGDYFFPNEGENYFKNILLGRNYDPTLPECGNNQRIIYVLDTKIAGPLTQSPLTGDSTCKDIPWHFDSAVGLSPKNCGHPDCIVRYQWGSVCNAGGAFDLANGRACPYYENPLMGPEADSDKLCTMSRMYAGDSITGGALLEMMWLSKGGLPWTKEEWESVWRVPYIWATVPFSPKRELTDTFRDPDGNMIRVEGLQVPEYKVYAVKTSVNLNTGKAEQEPPKLLPGGSISQYKRKPDEGGLAPGDQPPDLPTLIQNIEIKPIGSLNIVWPVADLSLLGLNIERSDDLMEKLKKLKSKPYNQLVWGPDSKNILVMGYGAGGQFANGVYCVNLAMLVGKWKEQKSKLISKLEELDAASPETQSMLKQLRRDLLSSQVSGGEKVIDGMELQKALLDPRGMFVFQSVPLNLLFKENFILVFGFSSASTISVAFTKVKPIFRRAYLYQSKASLMSGWKTVWNGRPSLFFNEKDLKDIAGQDFSDTEGQKIDTSVLKNKVPSANVTGTESLEELTERANLLAADLKLLNTTYRTTEDPVVRGNYVNQISEKSSALQRVQELIKAKTVESISSVTSSVIEDTETERSKLLGAMEEITREITHLEQKRAAASSAGYTNLANFYAGVIAELKYDCAYLQRQVDVLPKPTTEQTQPTEATERTPNWCVTVASGVGDPDTDEGGSLDTSDTSSEGNLPRLYVPFLNSKRKYQKNIDAFTSILPAGADQEKPKLEILKDSGIAEWKYLKIIRGNDDTNAPLKPLWTYAPKGAKRAVVYTTHDFTDRSTFQGAEITGALGRWYTLASCSSMIVLILNPELANRHNEFMIFNMWAEITYSWKGASGSQETLKRKIKFVPFNYTQVSRTFPAFDVGKTAKILSGTMGKFGVTHKKVSVSENIEIREKPEGNRHPWVFFAIACEEKSDVRVWPSYNGQWYPGGDLYITTLPQKKEQVKIYIDYAFIGEVYDQDDRQFENWVGDAESHKTRILFNHPRAGNIKSVFTVGEGDIGVPVNEGEEGLVDGFNKVPIGAAAATAMWPHARLACRDFEIHYVWRDNQQCTQVCDKFVMTGYHGTTGPRQTVCQDKRFTYYTHGDHDLGTVFTPKITFGQWVGAGIDRAWEEREMDYSWNTGSKVQAGDPTDTFPSTCKESKTPGNKGGPLYYPYTRSEPHSKFVPIHPIYIWDFLVNYRNKPQSLKYFGGFRMMATDVCRTGMQEVRTSTWETSYLLNTKNSTDYLGRCRTRGPLFQLEYDDYEEKKPKTIFLSPFAMRDRATRGATWLYYLRASDSTGENSTDANGEWEPEAAPTATRATDKVADNPNDLTKGVWKAICRSLYGAWAAGDSSAYWDLVEQKNWGAKRGWVVNFEGGSGLQFPDEEQFTPPDLPDTNEARKTYLTETITFYNNWIAKLQEYKALADAANDFLKSSGYDAEIDSYTALVARLQSELDGLTASTSPDTEPTPTEDTTTPEIPEEQQLQIDLVTGCHKSTLKDIGQKGSFFFDNTYMPGSVTSESAKTKLQEETKTAYEKMQKQVQRLYYYEQKSFGLNLPWSPYDSPPLFGNTGREMYIVELCTIGSVISWLPTSDRDIPAVTDKTKVPSWWTAREPEGDPVELVTLLPPPIECSRAIKTLSPEPQNPFYNYIFTGEPFGESEPDFASEYKPHKIRIATKHDIDSYGKAWYRSDVGRMTLTLTEESKLTNIKVFGNSPATKDSTYTSITTAAITEGKASEAVPPNPGDVLQDSKLPKNSMWGKDIKGLPIESGQKVFVGQRFPGYYSPYVHGKTFIGFKDEENGTAIHWAWPKSDRDILTRGQKTVKWWADIPDLGSNNKSDVQSEVKENCQIDPISSIKCAPYVQKHPAADDGMEVSLGPDLKKDSQPRGEREQVFRDETYYAIVVESEREKGGQARPPIIWAQQIDNADAVTSAEAFKRPKDGAVAYKVMWDGTITAVTLGKDDEDSIFTSGSIFPRTIRNTTPGGNFITSDKANAAGKYPAFDLGPVSYRHIGKVFSTKDFAADNGTFKKIKVVKTKNRYGFNNHLVQAELRLPNLSCDVLHIEITFNDFFFGGITDLFSKGNDGAAFELIVEGEPLAGTDYMADKYYKSYLKTLPFEKGIDVRDGNKVFYDLDLGMAKNLKLTFMWYIRCDTLKFDTGPWKGDDTKYDNNLKRIVAVPENISYLPDLINKITLGTLLAGKCAEVVKIQEAPFIVSTGAFSKIKKEETDEPTPYNLFTEADAEWYKCTWERSEKNIERKWDQKALYPSRSVGGPTTDEWARGEPDKRDPTISGGYDLVKQTFSKVGLNYNKFPQSREFPNSCVELPELPQSRLKIQAWADNVKPDSEGRTWTWGGIWTTRVSGPEWRTSDEYPSRDFIWWPAPHYYSGQIIMKGRAWFFGHQYKDEAKVMAKVRGASDDKYNKLAYKNEMTAYDKLLRNIEEFETYRSTERKSAAMQKYQTTKGIQDRKMAASQKSFDRMYQGAQAGNPWGAIPTPGILTNTPRNYMVNEYKEYAYLDEVGLTPERASWTDIKDREEGRQKDLYEDAKKLGSDEIENSTIKATAIIPYYDWYALMELTGKDWEQRNEAGDYSALTEETLQEIKDEKCEFTWKTWDWDEVQSFTFRDEYQYAYKPEGDIDKAGLLRRCGKRWTIFDKSQARDLKSVFVEATDMLSGDFTEELNTALASTKSGVDRGKINTLLQSTSEIVTKLTDMSTYYSQLGQKIWLDVATHMKLDTSYQGFHGYTKDQSILDALDDAITKTPTNITEVNAFATEMQATKLSSRALNKAILKTTALLAKISSTMESWRPQFQQVKQDMSYFKTVSEELITHSRKLVGALGISTREQKGTRIGIIDCHGEEDTDPRGQCETDGYPQKWEWDTERDVSSDWPSNISDDGGDSLKRPDPWWRY